MAAYLKLTDVEGGCTRENFVGQIELTSMNFGAHKGSATSGGRPGARCVVDSFTLTKKADRSSPTLLQYMVQNQIVADGTITFTKSAGDGTEVEFIKYELKNVSINSLNTTAQSAQGRDVTPDETISLSFDEVTSEYVGQGDDGTEVGGITFTWMLRTGG